MEPVNEFIQTEESQAEVPQAEMPIDYMEQYFMTEQPEKHISEACGMCNRTWASTSAAHVTTLLCGHSYHTICVKVHEYQEETLNICVDETCEYPSFSIVRDICRKRRQVDVDRVDDVIEHNLQKKSFKTDFKTMRSSIRDVMTSSTSVSKAFTNIKAKIIHKHIHTINQIQSELNTEITNVRKGEEMKKYRSSLRSYRKIAASIYRKYHISFRNLYDRKMLKVGWRSRWILERHRTGFNTYRYSIKILPGKKLWKDPIQDNDEDQEV
jgi:hypothetical protein